MTGPVMKNRLVFGVVSGVLFLDVLTKWWIKTFFVPGQSRPVLGDVFRLTYVLNPGAAFGLSVGVHSRVVFSALTVGATVVLAGFIRRMPVHQRGRLLAMALILGGALGNLVDRVRPPGEVVDFLDVGLGALRWPIFNVADVSVTLGAVLLLLLLRRSAPLAPPLPAAQERTGAPER